MPKSREVEESLGAALAASPEAFALHRIVRDEVGRFQDLQVLYTSPAAARLAGVASAEARR